MKKISDLLLLINNDNENPDADFIRRVVEERKATLVSFQFVKLLTKYEIEKKQFINWYYQYGLNLINYSENFKLRDIILLKTYSENSPINFILLNLWNWPESTYKIDEVRIPHEKETDSRNNPLGKNPGNIWSFSSKLDKGKKQLQSLILSKETETICKQQVELEVINRLVKCHTQSKDNVYIFTELADKERIAQLIQKLDRKAIFIPTGNMDIPQTIPIPFEELPIIENYDNKPIGYLDKDPKAIAYFTDCRYGINNLITEEIDDVVTSPPYNIHYNPFNIPKLDRESGKLVKPDKMAYKDDLKPEQYNYLLFSTFQAIQKKLNKNSSDVFVNIKNNYNSGRCIPPFWVLQLIPDEWKFTDLLVWHYDISYDPAKNKYKPYYEWVFRFTKGVTNLKKDHKFLKDFYLPILKGNSQEREGLKHPAIYPKKLVKICLKESKHTGLVVDPFLGSGTTIVASFELRRSSIGFELNLDFKTDIKTQLSRAMNIL